jgi:MFS family permease
LFYPGQTVGVTSTEPAGGVWSPSRRPLTAGLILTVTLVAFESLSVATVLPVVSRQLGGVRLYGWVFSAFFLGSLVGIVVAGRQADRVGLGPPFAVGLVLFGAGLAVGGAAPSMEVLAAARAVQGFGAGAIPAAAYVAIGRGYPPGLRPRMFAVLSTAWVVPGLIGPAASGLVADHLGWRWVFLGLLPLVAVACVLTLPQVSHLGPATGHAEDPVGSRALFTDAVRVAAGAGLVLAGLTVASAISTVALVGAGGLVGAPSFLRLVPEGTIRARRGLPAAILTRGVLTFAFFGADAYVPLTLTSIRGASATTAGIALTASTLTWTLGSWVQARWIQRWGPRRLIAAGFACIIVAIVGFATLLSHSVALRFGPATWAIAGMGMGLAYAPISLTVLHEAAPGREGSASSAMQLTDVLGVALGTGIGGAAVAFGHTSGWDPRQGLLITCAMTAAVGAGGLVLTRRFPAALS